MQRGYIDHLDLTVANVEASEPFYRAVLGHLGFQPVRLRHGNTRLRIFQRVHGNKRLFSVALQSAKRGRQSLKHDRYSPGLHHIAFRASSRADVDRLYKVLERIGARILDAPAEYPQYAPGYYAVFFVDPDGLKLEVVHMRMPPAVSLQNASKPNKALHPTAAASRSRRARGTRAARGG